VKDGAGNEHGGANRSAGGGPSWVSRWKCSTALSTDGSITSVRGARGCEQRAQLNVSGVLEWHQRFNSNQLTGGIGTMASNKEMVIGSTKAFLFEHWFEGNQKAGPPGSALLGSEGINQFALPRRISGAFAQTGFIVRHSVPESQN
jgi:hypothetical protein